MSGPPGLDGTTFRRLEDSMRFSEDARRAVVAAAEPVRQQVRREYAQRDRVNRTRTDPRVVEADADYRADENRRVRLEISKEQWGVRLATMYGIRRLVEQNDVIISLLGQLLQEVRGSAGLHLDQ